MIILTILEVFMIIVMGIWQWTIHVVAFFVHGFQVEMKFGMLLFRVGRMIGESGEKKKRSKDEKEQKPKCDARDPFIECPSNLTYP